MPRRTAAQALPGLGLTLLYRVAPPNGGLVFALEEEALEVDRINRALSKSRTWGEFRARMLRAEYSRVIRASFDRMGLRRPKASDAFDAEQVAG